jgi:hypothetical protein
VATTTDTGAPGEELRVRATTGLDPAVVRELSQLDAARATLSLARSWGLIAAAIAVAVTWPHPAVVAAAVLVIAD